MSDIKFSCPVCAQHISCTAEWAGMQVKCPACEKEIVIPDLLARPVAPPVPVAAGPLKVSVVAPPSVSHAAPPPPPPPAPAPAYPRHALAPAETDSSSGKGRRIATWAAVIVIVPVVLYMAFTWASSAQKKMNVARERDAEERDGGQLGHIAELNSVLDATDPGRNPPPTYDRGDDLRFKPVEEKLNPPIWTLDLAAAKVPSGKANGTISGSPFVADRAYLQKIPTGYALTVRQGMGFQAEREVMISLPLKATENLDGRTWQVSPASTNGGLRLIKRWLAAGRQQTKVYTNGYVMVLEFGRSTMDGVQARLFVALPDDEKTVVGGSFEASYLLAGGSVPRPVRRERDYEGDF